MCEDIVGLKGTNDQISKESCLGSQITRDTLFVKGGYDHLLICKVPS